MASETQTVTRAGKSFVIVERPEFERFQALVPKVKIVRIALIEALAALVLILLGLLYG